MCCALLGGRNPFAGLHVSRLNPLVTFLGQLLHLRLHCTHFLVRHNLVLLDLRRHLHDLLQLSLILLDGVLDVLQLCLAIQKRLLFVVEFQFPLLHQFVHLQNPFLQGPPILNGLGQPLLGHLQRVLHLFCLMVRPLQFVRQLLHLTVLSDVLRFLFCHNFPGLVFVFGYQIIQRVTMVLELLNDLFLQLDNALQPIYFGIQIALCPFGVLQLLQNLCVSTFHDRRPFLRVQAASFSTRM
mmetsp:Transcript_47256/g.79099  ORF Transcript_47256/g.79099 Transcript_47256/m.79099 type:complete len:240 (+) Transcript_47256:2387-3106(+)